MHVNTRNIVIENPLTWSHSTRRIVGDAVRTGTSKLHRSAQHSLLLKGLAVTNEANGIDLLPEVLRAYKNWLTKPREGKSEAGRVSD